MRPLLVRLGLAAALALLAGLGLLLAILPGQSPARALSSFSFEPEGLRALFLVGEALDLPVSAWRDVPERLPAAGTLLVLPHLPEPPPALPPALASGEGLAFRQSRALVHYGTFVEQGGTLLVLGVGAEELATLERELALDCLAPLELEVDPFAGGPLVLADGSELELAEGPLGLFRGARAALVRDAAGRAVGALQPCGAGRVALLALAAERFDNAHLAAEPDHALLFVRLVEALGPCERLAFDEYALGGWSPDTVPELALRPNLAALSLHALLLLLVLVWRSAWSGPFARDPAPVQAGSALARAQGLGALLARARRFDLLAGFLRAAWLERWDARAGRRAAGPSPEERLTFVAGGDERRRARLAELFAAAPASLAELERLERALAALEAELAGPARAPAPTTLARRRVAAQNRRPAPPAAPSP
ncbi:MAG TPA: hypothetical protein VF530_03170 [Planctomycetota bacterium]